MRTGEMATAARATLSQPVFRNPAPGLTPEEFISKIVALRPMIRSQQEQADAGGAYVQEVHEALRSFGAYGAVQPRRYGGHEFDVSTLLKGIIEMARSDPGTAWCYAFPAAHVLMLAGHYSEQAQIEIFGRNDGLAIAPLRAPTNGTLRKVKDGYVVDGSWDYASGVPYATHVMPTARLVGEGHEGPPTFLVPVIPAGQFRIVRESWGGDLTLGLRASGSQTFVVENAFVPDHMVAPFYNFQRAGEDLEGTPGSRLHDNPMYLGLTTLVFTAVISAILVGAAWAALDEFEEVLRTKRTINPPFHERYKSPEFQRVFGEVPDADTRRRSHRSGGGAPLHGVVPAMADRNTLLREKRLPPKWAGHPGRSHGLRMCREALLRRWNHRRQTGAAPEPLLPRHGHLSHTPHCAVSDRG